MSRVVQSAVLSIVGVTFLDSERAVDRKIGWRSSGLTFASYRDIDINAAALSAIRVSFFPNAGSIGILFASPYAICLLYSGR